MINHHPHPETLLAYVAGTLPWPHAVVVAAHMRLCPQCRAAAAQLQTVGSAVMAELAPACLAPQALARTLARLEEPTPPAPSHALVPTLAGLATKRWRWLAPGLSLMPLAPRDASSTRLDLIRASPGTALPEHGHTGQEMTCVLQGAFIDTTGAYRVGDLAEIDPVLEHQPVAMAGTDCICVIATTGRLRARSWIARLAQSLIDV
jgi:putative transcriptional regulator